MRSRLALIATVLTLVGGHVGGLDLPSPEEPREHDGSEFTSVSNSSGDSLTLQLARQFRSELSPLGRTQELAGVPSTQGPVVSLPVGPAPVPLHEADPRLGYEVPDCRPDETKIGRASCRERGRSGGGAGIVA